MLKKYLLYGICGYVLTLGSCNRDDDEVYPSYADQNWFQITDKPGEFNQLAYRIYTETGIPIFVNDTLGEENYTKDAAGNPLYRTETFNISFMLFGLTERQNENEGLRYIVQSSDSAAMIKAATIIRDEIIPRLPAGGEYRPKCYLMVDSLNDNHYGSTGMFGGYNFKLANRAVYPAQKGVVVGQLCDINKMTEDEIALWKGRVLAAKISQWIINTGGDDLKAWYDITDEGQTGASFYNTVYLETYITFNYDMLEKAGMFGWYGETFDAEYNRRVRATYTQEADIQEYIARVYAYRGREQDFRDEYKSYDKIVRKFDMMLTFVQSYELKFQIKSN